MLLTYTLLSILVLILISSLLLLLKHHSDFSGANLPPGGIGWPVIGESLPFLSACRAGHPEKFFFDRAARFPSAQVLKTSLLGEPTAVPCGAVGNKFLFANEGKLVRVSYPRSVFKIFLYSSHTTEAVQEEAKKLRKLASGFLKPEAIRRNVGVVDSISRRHFTTEWGTTDKVVRVTVLAKRFAFAVAAKLLAGLDDSEEVNRLQEAFEHVVDGLFGVPVDLPGTALNKAVKAAIRSRQLLVKVIKQRKAEMVKGKVGFEQDALSQMLVTCDDDGRYMTELDISDKILSLLVAGHDTVSISCTFIIKYLAELPHVYQAVYEEQMEIAKSKSEGELLSWEDLQNMKYSWNVAQEALRLAPPAPGFFREAISDFSFAGFSIPKGWKIFGSAHATHRNPAYFPDPEKFEPARFEGCGPPPNTFVAFGGGPRMCPGREYARAEILVFMHNLVTRYRWEMVNPKERISLITVPKPVNGLPIRLFPLS